jgi:DNA modification methylase
VIVFQEPGVTVHHGDCIDVMRELPDESVHAIVTDPPYGLSDLRPAQIAAALAAWLSGDRDHVPDARGFMGRNWDAFVPPPAVWDEALRVLKPGGHLLAFAGSRTVDLMGMSIRFAGFELRDSIAWLYGSGFPKSLDVSKAIDNAAGAEREVTGTHRKSGAMAGRRFNATAGQGTLSTEVVGTAPSTDAAREWEGWGTALKPAFEPVVVARKPLVGTVAGNVLAHGTGALNIDATRTETSDNLNGGTYSPGGNRKGLDGDTRDAKGQGMYAEGAGRIPGGFVQPAGRWPTNVLLDESQAAELDKQTGYSRDGVAVNRRRDGEVLASEAGWGYRKQTEDVGYGAGGGASRFFPTFRYEAKAPTSERPKAGEVQHPTVKPLDLMRWLVRLVTPKGGTILEPFAGSGTTLEAALLEGFEVIGIEREATYLPLIEARITKPLQPAMFGDWEAS